MQRRRNGAIYEPGGGEEQNDRHVIQSRLSTLEQGATETKRINSNSHFGAHAPGAPSEDRETGLQAALVKNAWGF